MNKTTLLNAVKSKQAQLVGTAVISLAVGAYAGFKWADKKLEDEYEERLADEITKTRRFYGEHADKPAIDEFVDTINTNTYKLMAGEYSTDETAAIQEIISAEQALIDEENAQYSDPEVEEIVVTTNPVTKNVFQTKREAEVFEDVVDAWSHDLEVASRDITTPYVINREEYQAGEMGYSSNTVTFYEVDQVLADSRDQVIDVDGLINADNLKFGHGSEDFQIVYVRNDQVGIDFEVVRHEGAYAEEVLNIIEHSDSPRRFRAYRGDNE